MRLDAANRAPLDRRPSTYVSGPQWQLRSLPLLQGGLGFGFDSSQPEWFVRAIFYIDSDRLVGHALNASTALMKNMPDLSMTFWVYGYADTELLEANGIAHRQFLPLVEPFDDDQDDGSRAETNNGQDAPPAVPKHHKTYTRPALGQMIRANLASVKTDATLRQRLAIYFTVAAGVASVLLFRASLSVAKLIGLILNWAFEAFGWLGATSVKVSSKVFGVFGSVVVALLRGTQRAVRAVLRTAAFLRRTASRIAAGAGRFAERVGALARASLGKGLAALRYVLLSPLLLVIAVLRGSAKAVRLGFGKAQSAMDAASRREMPTRARLLGRLDPARSGQPLSELAHGHGRARRARPVIVSRTARLARRAAYVLLLPLAWLFVQSSRASRKAARVTARGLERTIASSTAFSRRLAAFQSTLLAFARPKPTARRRAVKPRKPDRPLRSSRRREDAVSDWFQARVIRFYEWRNRANFRAVRARDERIYRVRNRYLVTRNAAVARIQTLINKVPVIQYMAFIRAHNNGFDRMILESRPDVVFLLENNVETTTHLLTTRLKGSGIRTVVVPFTIPNPDEAAQFYKTDASRQVNGPLSKLTASVFPKWTYDYEGKTMLRMAPSKVITFEALGLSDVMPWYPNSGPVDKILVESPAMQHLYEGLNFPAGQLACVGDAVDTTLQSRRRARARLSEDFHRAHGLDPGRPVVLCAFPPDQFGSASDGFEYDSYEDMIVGWTSLLNELSQIANVVIRPHPRVDPELLRRHCAPGVVLSDAPTAELVPLCDIYLACISATIRWALSVGIPVVNYDSYRYRYDDYDNSKATIDVETLEACRTVMLGLIKDYSAFEALESVARADMGFWGLHEGTFGSNLASVVRAL